jgi:hypothetical protein
LPDADELYPRPWPTFGSEPTPINPQEAAEYTPSNDSTHDIAQLVAISNTLQRPNLQGPGIHNSTVSYTQHPHAAGFTFQPAPSRGNAIHSNQSYTAPNVPVPTGGMAFPVSATQAVRHIQHMHAPVTIPHTILNSQRLPIANPAYTFPNTFGSVASKAGPTGSTHRTGISQITGQQVSGRPGIGPPPGGRHQTGQLAGAVQILRTNINASNGNASQAAIARGKDYILEDPPYEGWLEIIGRKWQEVGGATGNEGLDHSVNYRIDRLPRDFTMWSRLAPDWRTHYYIYGHPRGRFDAAKRFALHFVHLMRYNGGHLDACPCHLCP